MKKFAFLLGILLIFAQCAFAQTLQCGISYDVNSARQYVRDGQIDDIGPVDHQYFNDFDNPNVDIIYTYNNKNIPIGYGVRYKNNLKISYAYSMDNKLKSVTQYDNLTHNSPCRFYRYLPNGKLYSTGLIISKNNSFAFSPKGKLLARCVNGEIYFANTNIVTGWQSNY